MLFLLFLRVWDSGLITCLPEPGNTWQYPARVAANPGNLKSLTFRQLRTIIELVWETSSHFTSVIVGLELSLLGMWLSSRWWWCEDAQYRWQSSWRAPSGPGDQIRPPAPAWPGCPCHRGRQSRVRQVSISGQIPHKTIYWRISSSMWVWFLRANISF